MSARTGLFLLTLTAFIAAQLALACAFNWGGQARAVEICTTFGIETRLVPEDGAPLSDNKTAQSACPFCFQAAHVAVHPPQPPALPLPGLTVRTLQVTKSKAAAPQAPLLSYEARAPPAQV